MGIYSYYWSQMICLLTIWFMLFIKSWLLNICMQISIKIDLHIRVWLLVLHLHWWYTGQWSFKDVYKCMPNNMCTWITNKIIPQVVHSICTVLVENCTFVPNFRFIQINFTKRHTLLNNLLHIYIRLVWITVL